MQMTSEALERAIEQLARLPCTGRKSARRIAMHLLKQQEETVYSLAESLIQLKKSVIRCSVCGTITDSDPCNICSNPKRSPSQICVVEEFQDVYFIEKTNEFRGRYQDRKSTRLNSSHVAISYAVFCLKKKKIERQKRIE